MMKIDWDKVKMVPVQTINSVVGTAPEQVQYFEIRKDSVVHVSMMDGSHKSLTADEYFDLASTQNSPHLSMIISEIIKVDN